MTLNGVVAVTLRYFTEFGKPVFQQVKTASICGGIYARVYCILHCVHDVVKKVHVRYLILVMSFLIQSWSSWLVVTIKFISVKLK